MSANTHFTTTFISHRLRQLVFLPLLIGRIFKAHPLGLQNNINFYTPLLLDQRFSQSLLADDGEQIWDYTEFDLYFKPVIVEISQQLPYFH